MLFEFGIISPATDQLKSDDRSVTGLSAGVGTMDGLSFEGLKKKKKRFLLYVNFVNLCPPVCVVHIIDDGEWPSNRTTVIKIILTLNGMGDCGWNTLYRGKIVSVMESLYRSIFVSLSIYILLMFSYSDNYKTEEFPSL